MPVDTFSKNATKAGAASRSAIDLSNSMRNDTAALETAAARGDTAEVKRLEQKIRDDQANAVKGIGDQVLEGDAKKGFDVGIEAGKLFRDRVANDKSLFPDWEELTTDPKDANKTPLQNLGGNFAQWKGVADAAGFGKEFAALDAGMKVADLFDRYGLGDGKFAAIFGTSKQIADLQDKLGKGEIDSLALAQAGIGLDNLQAGLGMLSALGGVFGFGKDIAKVQKVVSALQGLQKAFSGDIAGGIDGILALDGLFFTLPPEAKEALNVAKKLANEMKRFKDIKPVTGPPGVFVESKEIAALGLSGTIHGIPLFPGPGAQTVLAFNMPVWRTASDKHVCPLPGAGGAPHMPPPGGVVPKGATKTYAEKLLIARHSDSTLEPNGGGQVQIIPLPEAMAIALKRAAEEAEKKRKAEEKKKAEKAAKQKAKTAKAPAKGSSREPESKLPDTERSLPKPPSFLEQGWQNLNDPAKWDEFYDKLKAGGMEAIREWLGDTLDSALAGDVKGLVDALFGGPAKGLVIADLMRNGNMSREEAEKVASSMDLFGSIAGVLKGRMSGEGLEALLDELKKKAISMGTSASDSGDDEPGQDETVPPPMDNSDDEDNHPDRPPLGGDDFRIKPTEDPRGEPTTVDPDQWEPGQDEVVPPPKDNSDEEDNHAPRTPL